ncbi:hypothetical protein SARC_03096 [Sphaeroforma arctica JP610]|uniref:Uncharacterized protein n=1 Tax=Sphaeroforma arctica JP610 TaxID=667725 RepID=A0A0L0G744_9EUKA|nr:hypothetical protein SARC_03096 [Sphaeroforma arctica JP610]KNC84691.1 hypothetical protein SARC_03096 [Sphaeroforma arctica JP610]|eukprot:XP_014158593.1 hypothetical protein SARC_03096 [Sphaeroforma arctica JP610]
MLRKLRVCFSECDGSLKYRTGSEERAKERTERIHSRRCAIAFDDNSGSSCQSSVVTESGGRNVSVTPFFGRHADSGCTVKMTIACVVFIICLDNGGRFGDSMLFNLRCSML